MAFYFVSTFANAQTPTKQRPYGYRGLKIITSLRLRFPDFQRRMGASGAPCYLTRNSGTPVAIIRSPTQRMRDALNALRPQRLRTKAASSLLPHWLDGYSECNSCSSRVLLAHVESANCPVAYQGLKITTSLSSVSMIFSGGQTIR
ncbi:hypothetical protein [Bathymodiolus japonicus methanotrophic gill symbiont]|uniref:hypothetical protein n=1 Tax=Bathymodiolus japonicus methanotrophic gill symbiont TaxID=113269 RepID=UPI001C8DEC2C|nr:hypothetical protein [Bathymodiolus japonicus methanotrophic gill symbiont]